MSKAHCPLVKSNFLYVNYTYVKGEYRTKIGISNNPHKRLNEFNNGLRYRFSFVDPPIFKRFFTIKIDNRKKLKRIERKIINHFKILRDPFYGNEVFKVHPEQASLYINDYLRKIYGMV